MRAYAGLGGRSTQQRTSTRSEFCLTGGNSTIDATYLHDSQGHRVAKFSNISGIDSAHFIHNLNGQLLAEATTGGASTSEYIWLAGLPLAMVTDADTASPRLYWLHTDHLGSPQKATDNTATLAWDTERTPFGELTNLTGSLTQPLRLPGQYADAETGLHQNWWRDYDPALGRYMTPDPIGLAGGANLYGYTGANPVSFTDRDGQQALAAVGAGFAADLSIPEPTDFLPAKWVGWGLALGSAVLYEMCVPDDLPPDISFNQDRRLSKGEIKKLKKGGEDPEQLKGGKRTGAMDLFKDGKGNISVKPRDGSGPGESTGLNINDF